MVEQRTGGPGTTNGETPNGRRRVRRLIARAAIPLALLTVAGGITGIFVPRQGGEEESASTSAPSADQVTAAYIAQKEAANAQRELYDVIRDVSSVVKTPESTQTAVPTEIPRPEPTSTSTPRPEPTVEPTATARPTETPRPRETPRPEPTATRTPEQTATVVPTATARSTETAVPLTKPDDYTITRGGVDYPVREGVDYTYRRLNRNASTTATGITVVSGDVKINEVPVYDRDSQTGLIVIIDPSYSQGKITIEAPFGADVLSVIREDPFIAEQIARNKAMEMIANGCGTGDGCESVRVVFYPRKQGTR